MHQTFMGSLLKERLQATKSREHEQEEVEAAAKLVAANDLSEDDEEVDEVKLRAAEESIVVDMDFAENYEIVHKVAIQGDHWSHQQVTLYIVIAHFKSGGKWTSEAHVAILITTPTLCNTLWTVPRSPCLNLSFCVILSPNRNSGL